MYNVTEFLLLLSFQNLKMIDIIYAALVLIALWFMYEKRKQITSQAKELMQQHLPEGFSPIKDDYKSLAQVEDALRREGLETSRLMLAVDFTKSNLQTGKRTFGGRSLHHIDPRCEHYANIPEGDVVSVWGDKHQSTESRPRSPTYPHLAGSNPELGLSAASAPIEMSPEDEDLVLNPYQQVIRIIGQTLKNFDDEGKIYGFGFGDKKSTDKSINPFHPKKAACVGFEEVIHCYNDMARKVELSGPTDFTASIQETIRIVRQTRKYTILLIVTDGEISNREATGQAIVQASNYPISIICIGVGDGPFEAMEEYDDELPERKFDNFQFVNFEKVVNSPHVENKAANFAMQALMEIPEQYKAIKKLGLINKFV
jgi:E3 ubiquitin-protein ligase RGLG